MADLDMIKLHVKRNQARCGPLTRAECAYLIERLEKAEAENDRLREALKLCLPLVEKLREDAQCDLGAFVQEGGGKPSGAMMRQYKKYDAAAEAASRALGEE